MEFGYRFLLESFVDLFENTITDALERLIQNIYLLNPGRVEFFFFVAILMYF